MAGRRGRSIYGTREWKAVRLEVLRAAGWRCARCKSFADEVHHRIKLADGGEPFDRDNLQAICRRCHLDEHLPPAERRARREWGALVRRVMRGQRERGDPVCCADAIQLRESYSGSARSGVL